jgi:ribosomal protein S17E
LQYLEEKGLEGWIPNFGQYKPHREGFEYNALYDRYECTKAGSNKAHLIFKGERTDSKGYTKKTYRSSEKDCNGCPFQKECCGAKTKFKKIDDTLHKPYYDRMHKRLQDNLDYAKRVSKIRSKTVEPVLGTLINFTNMRRVNTRGMKGAYKHVLMAALTYNLRKYMKFSRLKAITKAVELPKEIGASLQLIYARFMASIAPFRGVHFCR